MSCEVRMKRTSLQDSDSDDSVVENEIKRSVHSTSSEEDNNYSDAVAELDNNYSEVVAEPFVFDARDPDRDVERNKVSSPYIEPDEDDGCLGDYDSHSGVGDKMAITSPVIPDGGWGWVCVVSVAFISVIGVSLTQGAPLLYVAMRYRFQSGAADTALAFSLFNTATNVSGPFAGAACRRWGCRRCTILGGALLSSGLILTMISPNITCVYLTLGVICGCAAALCVNTCVTILNQYFDNKKSLAMSLAMMGMGVGGIIFPRIISALIDEYGYTGVFLVLAALHLNYIPGGALFRPPAYLRKHYITSSDKPALNVDAQTTENINVVKNIEEEEQSLSDNMSTGSTLNCQIYQSKTVPIECPSSYDKQNETTVNKSIPHRIFNLFGFHLLKQIRFTFFCLSLAVSTGGITTVIIFGASFAGAVGVSHSQLLTGMSVWAATTIIARPIGGILFDRPKVKAIRTHMYTVILLLEFVVFSCTPLISSFVGYIMFIISIAALASVLVTQELIIYGDLVGRKYYPNAIGLAGMFKAVGCLLGPTLGGLLDDHTHYTVRVYQACGVSALIAFIVFEPLNIYLEIKRRNRKAEK